jgi:hypothetical protein
MYRVDPAAKKTAAAWLRPGKIARLYMPEYNREKYFIVGSIKPELLLITINSIPRHANRTQNCAECQVPLRQADYPFFTHLESYANCYMIVDTLTYAVALGQLIDNPKWRVGDTAVATRRELVQALRHSEMIEPIRLRALEAGLG